MRCSRVAPPCCFTSCFAKPATRLAPDDHVTLETCPLVLLDILADLATKLLDANVRAVLLELVNHARANARDRREVLGRSRVQIERHEDKLRETLHLIVIDVLADLATKHRQARIRPILLELMGHPIADAGNQKNLRFGHVVEIDRQPQSSVQLILLLFAQAGSHSDVQRRHAQPRPARNDGCRALIAELPQRRQLLLGSQVGIQSSLVVTNLGK